MNSPDSEWPPDEDAISANQIDLICDEFESFWKSEGRPQITEYLYRVEEQSRAELLIELVRLDYAYRLEQGETPSSEEYVSLFPDFSDVLLTRVNEFSSIEKDVSEAPSRIGEIELIEKVGFGAFGTVWRAWDLDLKRQVAVKLPSSKLEGKQQVDLFLHEAQAAAKLHHPHIVPVYSSGQINGRGYIVFKFIKGQTLRELLNKQTLTAEQAAQLCLALADGLEHAHQQRVIHRDLKPSNILIDEAGQPHITDFGLAKRIDETASLAHSGTVLGTLAYMSPEQARGRSSEIEGHSDIYSLGAILYRILTKQVPFEGEAHEVLHQILNKEPVAPRKIETSIPRDLETICLKAISKSKRDRYQTASEMAADLKRFLEKKPIHSRRVSLLGRLWRKVIQRPVFFGLAASLMCLTVFLTVKALFPAHPPSDTPIVTLNTTPEGAKVAFIPLSKKNGEPMPEQIIHAAGTSPVTLPLEPGDYLVVAYFDNEWFHEVYRHVPEKHEGIPEAFRHQRFTRDPVRPNHIELPELEILAPHEVTQKMALIKGSDEARFGINGNPSLPEHYRSIPDFWMDPMELSVEKYTELFLKANSQPAGRMGSNYAVILNYDIAVFLAEKLGKRLPTEFEWEYAATQAGKTQFPWGNMIPANETIVQNRFQPVGLPLFDQLPTNPPVFGLCSNVAEWTSSQFYPYPVSNTANFQETPISLKDHRVVKGGTDSVVIDGNPAVNTACRDSRSRSSAHRLETHLGLGVRFVRSSYPRLNTHDFPTILSPNNENNEP
tara:strand:- start:21457 stop:23784 length:2328 start_codon:yes stop_codon:yes gene_type:complete